MKSLHQAADRDEVLARLARLQADSRHRWGRMSVGQMLCHLGDALRMSLGDLKVSSKRKWLFQVGAIKHLIIHVLPFPKGAPTAAELLSTSPVDFEGDRTRLRDLIARFAATPQTGQGPEHPLFGSLEQRDWGALHRKHFDHHLRQFGV